jgi:hypothetical protein
MAAMDRRSVLLAGGALVALPLGSLRAQAFPSRPITLYCAFPPAARPTRSSAGSELASRTLGQAVIVKASPAAAARSPARAEECATRRIHAVADAARGVSHPHMQKSPQLDPIKDFTYGST